MDVGDLYNHVTDNRSAHLTTSNSAKRNPPSPQSATVASAPVSVRVEEDLFFWDERADIADRFASLGLRLAARGDLYRYTDRSHGLLLVSREPVVPPRLIRDGRTLGALIGDRLRIRSNKKGRMSLGRISASDLSMALESDAFLEQFQQVDEVTRTPMYLPDFTLTVPGYNNGGPGHRVLYIGETPIVECNPSAISPFLQIMAFGSNADRTNTVAAALTVMLRNHFPGGKPVLAVTASKSHAGKDTVILFAAGTNRISGISYQTTDWALERAFVGALAHCPDTAVVSVENARLDSKQSSIASAYLERFLTDVEPLLFSTGTGPSARRQNHLVVAISTNFGTLSADLLNRALPIHLRPLGDINDRISPIGNPKTEYLPTNGARIEAELRGMIEKWKSADRPLDNEVRHPFSQWAATIGGILRVNGFTDFLANYNVRRTVQDPLRHRLGLLGAYRPDAWRTAAQWAADAISIGVQDVIPGGGPHSLDHGKTCIYCRTGGPRDPSEVSRGR